MAQFDLQHFFFASFGPYVRPLISHTNSRSGHPWKAKKGYIDLSDACSSNCRDEIAKKGYIDLSDACSSNCRDEIEPWSSNKNCMEVIESWNAFHPISVVNLTIVHQYCNGLFLLYCESIFQLQYHICNPATNQCLALPEPPLDPNLRHVIPLSTLAFDPSLSHHYKVVRFSQNPCSKEDPNPIYLVIFSSKERRWIDRKVLPETFSLSHLRGYDLVFLNGAMHFIIQPNSLYRFDVEELSGRTIKLPKSPSTFDMDELCHELNLNGRCIRIEERKRYFKDKYIGKCQGHIFYIRSACDHSEREIWMLQNFETGEWLLQHTIRNEKIEKHPVPVIPDPYYGFSLHPLTIHPNLEVIFMNFQGKILSYHFGSKMSDNDRLEEVCSFGIDRCVNLAVPYSRCLSFLNPPLAFS